MSFHYQLQPITVRLTVHDLDKSSNIIDIIERSDHFRFITIVEIIIIIIFIENINSKRDFKTNRAREERGGEGERED